MKCIHIIFNQLFTYSLFIQSKHKVFFNDIGNKTSEKNTSFDSDIRAKSASSNKKIKVGIWITNFEESSQRANGSDVNNQGPRVISIKGSTK